MGPLNLSRVSSVPALSKYLRWGGAVIRGGLPASNDRLEPDLLDSGPTADEWCRALAAIAEQVLLHLTGYIDEKDFAKDGGRFIWDRVRCLGMEAPDPGH